MIASQPIFPAAVPFRPVPRAGVMERARGAARLTLKSVEGRTVLAENYQSGSARFRFPNTEPPDRFTAVLLNTAGGITGGDEFSTSVTLADGADAAVTTQAAERIYRRSAGMARIETTLTLGKGATLAWLPQETILFDRAGLARSLSAEIDETASLLAVESIVLGRAAMGETIATSALTDRWRIRRGGRMVFADGLRLEGDATSILSGGATGKGATALATLVLVAPDAERRLSVARATLADCGAEAGASAWNGMLVARLLAPGGAPLRAALIRLIESLRGLSMPRVWHC
ncbi:urease accessory protein UreD [soil metagenome]